MYMCIYVYVYIYIYVYIYSIHMSSSGNIMLWVLKHLNIKTLSLHLAEEHRLHLREAGACASALVGDVVRL